MAAGKYHRASHLAWRIVAKVEELNVKVKAKVDNGIGVPYLTNLMVGPYDMNRMMIVQWFWSNQTYV